MRAVAVLCVIAYHLGLPWAPGGMLGVGVFFTLSGYLITDLLISHWLRHGRIGLRRFWLRRARRLLPALFVMLAAVAVWVALFDASQLGAVRRQVIGAALYVANWSTIAQHGSYFSNFAAPLPLDHLWSLAIEEQFYLLWPWILLGLIWAVRNRGGLVLVTVAAAAGSLVAMSLLYHPGYDPTRVYEGTDTRAFGLLAGAALAVAWPIDRAAPGSVTRKRLDALGAAGLIGILVLVSSTSSLSPFLYPYGLILLTVATLAVLAAVVDRESWLGAGLGWSPLRWIGVRSYGIYLWQWPVIVLLNPAGGGISFWNAIAAVTITLLIAAVSWRYIEDPIRHGALSRRWQRLRSGAGHLDLRRRAFVVSSLGACALALPVLGLSGLLPTASTGSAHVRLAKLPPPALRDRASRTRSARFTRKVSTRSSCRSVVYIGDSTSEGEVSSEYIPNPRQRLESQLTRVGVGHTYPEVSGARSIVEPYQDNPNAASVAEQYISDGYRGCWIFALGTNDSANVAAGADTGRAGRVEQMMSIVHREPVMWVDVISLRESPDPYSEDSMRQWNHSLTAACSRYPNMRVFDWAGHVRERWFISDGIHYTSPGYVHRTRAIARALARAFPSDSRLASGCLVR